MQALACARTWHVYERVYNINFGRRKTRGKFNRILNYVHPDNSAVRTNPFPCISQCVAHCARALMYVTCPTNQPTCTAFFIRLCFFFFCFFFHARMASFRQQQSWIIPVRISNIIIAKPPERKYKYMLCVNRIHVVVVVVDLLWGCRRDVFNEYCKVKAGTDDGVLLGYFHARYFCFVCGRCKFANKKQVQLGFKEHTTHDTAECVRRCTCLRVRI